jgi:hypothetical protein
LVYAPSEVTAKAGNGVEVKFSEETQYPFDGKIMFTFTSSREVEFPFHLRIPAWCNSAVITINGKEHSTPKAGTIAKIARTWKRNDKVEVFFPMEVRLSRWHEESVGVERGPLVFALRIGEEWRKMKGEEPYATYAVYPKETDFPLRIPSGKDAAYEVTIYLVNGDEITGGYIGDWQVSRGQIENADEVIFHAIEQGQASDDERFLFLSGLASYSQQVPAPEIR